jgi:mannose-6-phosphate isomerase-like protein (cupin superfamily)
LHRHPSFVETFIVCEGHYEFEVDTDRYILGPGESIAIARGAPHALTSVGPETGRLLDITSPAGVFEAFIREVCGATARTAAGESPVDFRAIARSHGIEFLT